MEQEFMKKKKMEEEEELQQKRRDMEAAVATQKLAENQWGNNKAGISTPIAPQNQKKGGGLQQTHTNVKNMKQQQQAKKTDSKSIASKKQQQSKPQKGKPKKIVDVMATSTNHSQTVYTVDVSHVKLKGMIIVTFAAI